MLIKSFTAAGSQQITQRFSRFEFICTFPKLTTPVLFGNVKAVLDNLMIEVVRTNNSGSATVVQKVPLTNYLLLCTGNEGMIQSATDATNTVVRGIVEVAASGALPIYNNDYWQINVTSAGAWTAGLTLDVYGIDMPLLGDSANFVESLYFEANTTKTLNVVDTKLMCFPKATLDKLEYISSDGTQTVFTRHEAEAIMRDGIMQIASDEGLCRTFQDSPLLVFNVAGAMAIKLTFTAAATVFKLNQVKLS